MANDFVHPRSDAGPHLKWTCLVCFSIFFLIESVICVCTYRPTVQCSVEWASAYTSVTRPANALRLSATNCMRIGEACCTMPLALRRPSTVADDNNGHVYLAVFIWGQGRGNIFSRKNPKIYGKIATHLELRRIFVCPLNEIQLTLTAHLRFSFSHTTSRHLHL